jgi:SAM-dependent methyltransferase
MITDRSPKSGQTSSATTGVRPVDVMFSLLSNLVRQHGRTPRVLELGTAESEPLTAPLAREMPIEPVHDNSKATPDAVIIHPQLGLSTLVHTLYAVRDDLATETLLCGPGVDQPEHWPGLQIALEQFIQDYRSENGFWIALPTGITHLKRLPPFDEIVHLVKQVETDLQAELAVAAQAKPEKPGRLTADLVTSAFRVLLEREPRGAAEVEEKIEHCSDMRELRHNIIRTAEFKQQNTALFWLNFSPNEPPMQIQMESKDTELQALLAHIQSSWEHLGTTEPHWSVLTAEQYKRKNIADNEDAFYQTGKQHVESLWQSLRRNGVDPASLKTCIEYGCGLGRVTRWLAERFDKVYGYDISRAHLEAAGNYLSREGFHNVSLRHIGSPAAVAQLEPVDLVYSLIVLQHNPPPIIAMIVRGLLAALKPGGVAYFQVPTYQRGYYFSCSKYLSSFGGEKEMEMHVLPQSEIFAIVTQSLAQVLEVFEDSCTGIVDGGRSNTFVVRKNR